MKSNNHLKPGNEMKLTVDGRKLQTLKKCSDKFRKKNGSVCVVSELFQIHGAAAASKALLLEVISLMGVCTSGSLPAEWNASSLTVQMD